MALLSEQNRILYCNGNSSGENDFGWSGELGLEGISHSLFESAEELWII